MKRLALLVLALLTSVAMAAPAPLPPLAVKQIPVLHQMLETHWPEQANPALIAGQIEQESCVSLKSLRCWSSTAELKTSREYGFGLGQITIAYNKDGTVRFNKFQELTQQFSVLRNWKFSDRHNSEYQLTAIVMMDRNLYNTAKWSASERDRMAFMFSAYNGGMGGVLQDRRLCTTVKGCDQNKWFGNVELYSFKNKTKLPGYGQSNFQINREYVTNIYNIRHTKYLPYLPPKK